MFLKYKEHWEFEGIEEVGDVPELKPLAEKLILELFKEHHDSHIKTDSDWSLFDTLREYAEAFEFLELVGNAFIKEHGIDSGVVYTDMTEDGMVYHLFVYEVVPESYEDLEGLVRMYQRQHFSTPMLEETIVDHLLKENK